MTMVLRATPATPTARPGFEPMESDTVDTSAASTQAAPAPGQPVPPATTNPITTTAPTQPAAAPAAAPAAEPVQPAQAPAAAPAPAPAAAAAAPAPAPAPVPATVASNAVATVREPSAFAQEVANMRGAADFSYGNFEVYKAANGSIRCKDPEISLGRWVQGTMLAWDEHFEISPGSDEKAAKDAVGYSKDGKTIDNIIGEEYNAEWQGKLVKDYLAFLRGPDIEFRKADIRRFIDISIAVQATDKATAGKVGEIIQVTLAQSSIPSFSSYQQGLEQKAKAVAKGIPGFKIPTDPFTFYMYCVAASKGDNEWTKIKVDTKLPADLAG